MRVILHFGMHKTASTSIQASLQQNLSDPRFYYAQLSGAPARPGQPAPSNHSGHLRMLFMEDPLHHHINRKRGRTADAVERLRDVYRRDLEREIAKAQGRTLIL